MWFAWEGGTVWIIGNRRENSLQSRIERDPRCAVGVVDFDRERGVVQHVGSRGRATVEPFDRERARRVFFKYLGGGSWDERFTASLDDLDNLLVRFEPEVAVIRDQSYRVNEQGVEGVIPHPR